MTGLKVNKNLLPARCRNYATRSAISDISIPLWCDWNNETIFNITGSDEFQFHYGAIGTVGGTSWTIQLYKFQFHYGAIGTISCI